MDEFILKFEGNYGGLLLFVIIVWAKEKKKKMAFSCQLKKFYLFLRNLTNQRLCFEKRLKRKEFNTPAFVIKNKNLINCYVKSKQKNKFMTYELHFQPP